MTTNSLIERHLEGIADYLDPEVIGDSEAMHDAPGKLREAAAELRRVSTECEALREALEATYAQAKLFNRDTDAVWCVIRDKAEAALQQTNKEAS